MSTMAQIKLGFKKWLNEETGIPFIFEEQATPRPSVRPYGTIRIMDQSQVGGDDSRSGVSALGIQTSKGVREGVISLNIYGDDALEKMSIARDSMFKETTHDKLYVTYGVSVTSSENIQNLTGLLETDFEERAQMDVNILYARESTDDVGLIEHVAIEGEANGITISEETIDLP